MSIKLFLIDLKIVCLQKARIEMTKIAIVDDHLALLDRLETDLEKGEYAKIIFQAQNGLACLNLLASLNPETIPDIILMDISMPQMDGIEATRQIQARYPAIQVVMLTATDEDDKIFEAIRAGAKGYLLKTESAETILRAIEEVRQGGTYLTPSIARKTLNFLHGTFKGSEPNASNAPKKDKELITPRESEILHLLSKGLTYQNIAQKLSISLGTLKKHTYNIYEKLQVENKTQAINKLNHG